VQTVVEPGAPAGSEAFAVWVAPHLLAMTRLARRLAPQGDHDDIVQEALVRAWRKRSTFDASRGPAQSWLLAIVADRARRARVRQKPPAAELPDDAAGPSSDLDPALELAVRQLPRRQRMAVELFYYLGLPVHECAAVLGVADGTVKSALSDARARLRTLLEVHDD